MTSSPLPSPDPSEALQTTVIRTTFVLLYDRDPVTRNDAQRLPFPTVAGDTDAGVPAARRELTAALAAAPEAFAHWLSGAERTKLLMSVAQGADDDIRAELRSRGAQAVLSVLMAADGVRARELSVYRDTSGVIDLRDQTIDLRSEKTQTA